MKRFPSAELEAERLLRETVGYDPAKSVGVHVEEIAKALGIRIRTAPLPRGVDAWFCRPGPTITLLRYKPPCFGLQPYHGYIIAHVLGHYALHPESSWSIEEGIIEYRYGDIRPNRSGARWNDPEEQWASEFAHHLIIPTSGLRWLSADACDVDRLACEFHTSRGMALEKIRLMGEGDDHDFHILRSCRP